MEKVRPWCGQPLIRGPLKNRTERTCVLRMTACVISERRSSSAAAAESIGLRRLSGAPRLHESAGDSRLELGRFGGDRHQQARYRQRYIP